MDGIARYDEYEDDFRLLSLPEYRWMAEQLLNEALEDYCPPENLNVFMPDCLCNDISGYTFLFTAVQKTAKKPIRCSTRAFIKFREKE